MQYVEMVRKEVTDATESGLILSAGQKLLRDWCIWYILLKTPLKYQRFVVYK